MGQTFSNIGECNDYIEFLEMKENPIPDWVKAEKERIERESAIPSTEYIFGTMAAHNPFMTEEKEQVVRGMTDQLMTTADNASQPCLLLGKVQCGKTDTFLSIM